MIVPVSKGQQITIPSKYRKLFGLKRGSKVELIKKGDRLIIMPIKEDMETIFGEAMKLKPMHGMTAKQMDELVEHEILGQ
ncbi:AbrB/MazE/SpoVT family DNA-binding domain-containing protein [Candidatus Woesearchaeota archaeon]|nr:AbrB/MazE/SpoVT family DNA-binding domain-containing protein [Candidatus Woesearchaeota archaeon]